MKGMVVRFWYYIKCFERYDFQDGLAVNTLFFQLYRDILSNFRSSFPLLFCKIIILKVLQSFKENPPNPSENSSPNVLFHFKAQVLVFDLIQFGSAVPCFLGFKGFVSLRLVVELTYLFPMQPFSTP